MSLYNYNHLLIYDLMFVAYVEQETNWIPFEVVINIGIKGEIRSPRFFSYLNSLYFTTHLLFLCSLNYIDNQTHKIVIILYNRKG